MIFQKSVLAGSELSFSCMNTACCLVKASQDREDKSLESLEILRNVDFGQEELQLILNDGVTS